MQRYSSDNLELVRSCYEAIEVKDFDTVHEAMDPNVEWIEPEVPGLWFQGKHRGPDAVFKEVIQPTSGRIAEFRVETDQFVQVGEHIVVIGRFRGRGKTTCRELNASTVHIWTVRNGKIVRFQAFHDVANWLDAMGTAAYEAQRLAA